MDRQITHTGALIPNATLLGGEKAKLFAIGHALDAVLGGSTCVGGLACTPTSPASLQVVIGAGSIMTKAAIDGTNAFGDLGTDITPVVKQGLLLNPLMLPALTPPAASGYSQVFLVQAAQSDQDSGTVLPYYNAANPAQPFNGPANSGASDVTLRTSACVVAIKPGIAATSGTQQAPAPDPGYTGLYAITLTNGQTQITSANIAIYPGAPFIPVKLPAVPAGVQSGQWLYGIDTGSSGALTVALTPAPTATPDGMEVRVRAGHAAAGGDTFSLNGFGAYPILRRSGLVPNAGDWAANDILTLRKLGSAWQLAGLVGSDAVTVLKSFGARGQFGQQNSNSDVSFDANAQNNISLAPTGTDIGTFYVPAGYVAILITGSAYISGGQNDANFYMGLYQTVDGGSPVFVGSQSQTKHGTDLVNMTRSALLALDPTKGSTFTCRILKNAATGQPTPPSGNLLGLAFKF